MTPTGLVPDGSGHVEGMELVEVERFDRGRYEPVPGTERVLGCDLVLLALGFCGAEPGPLLDDLGAGLDAGGALRRDARWRSDAPGVFVAGDAGRGASLVVWAIAEGRAAAAAIDRFLGGGSELSAPVTPATVGMRA